MYSVKIRVSNICILTAIKQTNKYKFKIVLLKQALAEVI